MKVFFNRKISGKLLTYLAALAAIALMLFPFAWMLSTSLKGPEEIYSRSATWIPKEPTLQNYRHVLNDTLFPRWFMNSLIAGLGATFLALVFSITAAYSISRLDFRGKKAYSVWLLYTQMIPKIFLLLPLFIMIRSFQLLNTYASIILTHATVTLPFAVWMLKGYFDTIPKELEEAARIDGCSQVGTMWRIVLPLALPGIIAVALFVFIVSWQEYMFSLTFVRSTEMRTLPVGISLMLGDTGVLWGRLMAASVLITIPIVFAFIYLQKYLIQGMTSGSIK